MFAARWFVVFGPLVMLWAGAWLRRPHRRRNWVAAGLLLAFSAAVGVVGATRPWPRNGYDRYTAAEAARRLWTGNSAEDGVDGHGRMILARPESVVRPGATAGQPETGTVRVRVKNGAELGSSARVRLTRLRSTSASGGNQFQVVTHRTQSMRVGLHRVSVSRQLASSRRCQLALRALCLHAHGSGRRGLRPLCPDVLGPVRLPMQPRTSEPHGGVSDG
jgi:hypothetical protein